MGLGFCESLSHHAVAESSQYKDHLLHINGIPSARLNLARALNLWLELGSGGSAFVRWFWENRLSRIGFQFWIAEPERAITRQNTRVGMVTLLTPKRDNSVKARCSSHLRNHRSLSSKVGISQIRENPTAQRRWRTYSWAYKNKYYIYINIYAYKKNWKTKTREQ